MNYFIPGKSAQVEEDIEVNDEDTEAPVTSIPVGKKIKSSYN